MDRRELGAGEHMAGNSPAQAEAGPVTLIRRPFLASREIVKVVRWFESHRHLLLEDRATDTMEEVGNNRWWWWSTTHVREECNVNAAIKHYPYLAIYSLWKPSASASEMQRGTQTFESSKPVAFQWGQGLPGSQLEYRVAACGNDERNGKRMELNQAKLRRYSRLPRNRNSSKVAAGHLPAPKLLWTVIIFSQKKKKYHTSTFFYCLNSANFYFSARPGSWTF